MIFFGWGRKTKTWVIKDSQQLVAMWNYFSIFWCPTAFNVKWHLLNENRSEDKVLTEDEVSKLLGVDAPSIGIWNSCGLWLVIGGLVILSIMSS